MQQIEIEINGFKYSLACDTGQEAHISKLAAEIDSRARQVATDMPGISEAMALMMSSLMLADELHESRNESATLHREGLRMNDELNQAKTQMQNMHNNIEHLQNSQSDHIAIKEQAALEAQNSMAFVMEDIAKHIDNMADNIKTPTAPKVAEMS